MYTQIFNATASMHGLCGYTYVHGFYFVGSAHGKLGEKKLRHVIEALFPTHKNGIIFNAKKEAGVMKNSNKKIYYELDVWIPTLNIGFEYQVCT